jgi:uncharacterized protein with GYD domain
VPSYLSLASWTDQGARNMKDSPARLEAFKETVKNAGGRLIFFYLLMGEHDFATLIEVPDDATAARVVLELGRLGNIRTHTMKAFTEDEYRGIIASLS